MPNFTFEPVQIVKIKGYPAYQFKGKNETGKNTMLMNIVFISGISYGLACMLPNGTPETNRSTFLSSISVEK